MDAAASSGVRLNNVTLFPPVSISLAIARAMLPVPIIVTFISIASCENLILQC